MTRTLPRPTRGQWVAIAHALVPWSWFAVRDLHPRLDAVALGWPVIGAAAVVAWLVVAAIARRRRPALVALSWMVAFLAVVVGPWRPLDTGDPVDAVRVVAANTYGDNTDPPVVRASLRAQAPDVLVISEVTDRSAAVLGAGYRHRARSQPRPGEPTGDLAVFTDLPMRAGPLPATLRDQSGVRAEIDGPGGRFVLYALHLQKPGVSPSRVEVGFRTHGRLIHRIVAAVEAETLPVVVAGDLNLADRTSGYRALTGVLDDAMRAGWSGPTSLRPTTRLLLARIDHILMPESWCSTGSGTFTIPGSDHRGVAAALGPCASGR